jgi:hypothetical protein
LGENRHRSGGTKRTTGEQFDSGGSLTTNELPSRRINQATRDAVYERDGGRRTCVVSVFWRI